MARSTSSTAAMMVFLYLDELSVGPHFLDIDEGIETAEIEQRPIRRRAK
jgi:hypothetical protein